MRQICCAIFSIFFLLGSTAALAAQSVFVREVKGGGTADEKQAVRDLVTAAVSGASGYHSTDKEAGANVSLEPRLVKLGNSYVLYLNKIVGGDTKFSQQMRSATFDDIDTVSTRLTRAVLNEVQVKDDKKVSEVTQDEVNRGMVRREVTRQWMIGFGPMWLAGVQDNGKSGLNFLVSYLWGVSPLTSIQFGFEGGGLRDSDSHLSNFFLGVNQSLSEADTSPFVMGAVGYGSAGSDNSAGTLDDTTASGFTISLGGGVKFFQTSKVNLALSAKGVLMTDQIGGRYPFGILTGAAVCF